MRMKAKVINSFVCKKDGKLKAVGTIVDYDEKRIEELAETGFVSKTEAKPEETKQKKK